MEKRIVPHTDISVSELCLGTMNFGTMCDEAEAHRQLDHATNNGINFIDTAEVYPIPPDKSRQGTTERFVGSWLKSSGRRDSLIIASKVSSRGQAGSIASREGAVLDAKNILQAIDGSLERLGVEYLDLYQVHVPERKANYFGVRGVESLNPDDGVAIEESLEALSQLVRSGKVRHIGVSNETPWGVGEYLRLAREKGLARIVTIQNQYSLINRTFEIGLSEMCLREGVGLLAYSPLSKGVLSGKYLGGVIPPNSRFAYAMRDFDRYNPARAQLAIQKYKEVAEKHGMTLAVMSLAFILTRSFTTSVILGARNMEQLKEDMSAAEVKLSPEIMADIQAVYNEFPDPTA